MQKASVLGQMSEFPSTVFLSISIFVEKCQFCAKKVEILGRNVVVYTTTESDYLFAKYAYF